MSNGRHSKRRLTRERAASALRSLDTEKPRLVGSRAGVEIWMVGKAMFLLPAVPPHPAPLAVREAIARRRLAALEGRCPCGAERRLRGKHGQVTVLVEHEDGCPASDAALARTLREHE